MNKVESYVWTRYEPLIESQGLEFADVVYIKEGPTQFLRLFIDQIDRSPITIEDCERVSRLLTDLFDQDEDFPVNRAYTLEVSSPGIERPLKRPRDFNKFIGEDVRVRLYQALNGQKNYVGKLQSADDEGIELILDDQSIALNYDQIAKANLYYEFN